MYRFGTSLYFANASRFVEDVITLTRHGDHLRWLVLDGAAIGDVDYTASAVLSRAIRELHQAHIKVMMTSLVDPVRQQLRHYGISGEQRAGRVLRHPGRGAGRVPRRRPG